jgi:lipoprotein-anchoring transpeptidase ErfK/SrfK
MGEKGIGKYVELRYVASEPVRSGANPNAASLGSLANGKQLELTQEAAIGYNGYTYYLKAAFNGKTGYIRTRYMDEVRPDGYFAVQPDYSKYTDYVRVKCSGNLNVRTSADLNSTTNILSRRAEHGDVLALKSTTQANGCWQVEFNGEAAYVSAGASYTERINPTAIPSGNKTAQNAAWAAIVNQKNQTVSVYQNKTLMRLCTCTTGGATPDRLTPVGTFTHKQDMNGLPGKKSLFLSWHTSDPAKRISGLEDLTVFDCVRITGSVYFHRVPRQANNSYDYYKARLNAAGSHGCIRIPEVHSRWMYGNFAYGGVVVVQPL